jgi:hypothetical protein
MTPQQKWYRSNRELARERSRLSARKPASRKRQKSWAEKNPDKVSAIKKRYRVRHPDRVKADKLRRLYGLTLEEQQAMVEDQGGKCAICATNAATHVDHNHKTGEVRGILCNGCNRGLGFFKDSRIRLLSAALYLEGAHCASE